MEIVLRSNPESRYENLRTYAPAVPTTGAQIAANGQFLAYLDTNGSGACMGLLPLSSYGKNHIPVSAAAYQQPLVRAHSQIVQDFAFSPFNSHRLYTCAADKVFKLWAIQPGGLSVDLIAPTTSISLASKAPLYGLSAHLSAESIVAVRSSKEVAVLDLAAGREAITFKPDIFGADIQTMIWSYAGDVLLTIAKDKQVRLLDPRSASVAASVTGHGGLRFSAAQWLGDSPHCITGGLSAQGDREMLLWDSRSLDAGPVSRETLDRAAGALFLNYDPDTRLLLLTGRGDASLRTFRFTEGRLKSCIEGIISADTHMKDTVRGLALLPKSCALRNRNETLRALKLTENLVQTVSFMDTTFQPTETVWECGATLTAEQWLAGENGLPSTTALPPVVPEETSSTESAGLLGGAVAESGALDERSSSPVPGDSKRLSTAQRVSSMASNLRCRHLYGSQNKKELTAFNLSPDLSALDNPILTANDQMWAMPYRSGGGGGPILLSKLDTYGRVPHDCATLNGHKTAVQDLSFSPFHSHLMISGAVDSAIKLWDVNPLFVDGLLDRDACAAAEPLLSFQASSSVRSLLFHPTVDRLLASAAQDSVVRLHDLVQGEEVASFALGAESTISNLSFSFDGTLLATASKDKIVRILDPRLAKSIIAQTGSESSMGRSLRVLWCGRTSQHDPLVTVAAGSGGMRQLGLWDPRNLTAPLAIKSIDNASGQLFPLFDEGLNVVYVAGKGDTILRAYEISSLSTETETESSADKGLMVDKVMEFHAGSDPIAGICMLPKRLCDVRTVEVTRLLKLTQDSVSGMSFRIPRADHLKTYFQDDLFPPTRAMEPSATAEDWLNPEADAAIFAPRMVSLQPEDMAKVSDRPPEPTPSQTNSKVNSFRLSIQKKEEEDKQREGTFAKLQALAIQNANYHVNLSGGKDRKIGGVLVQKAVVEEEEDSDDGW